MKNYFLSPSLVILVFTTLLSVSVFAIAQVAGSTTTVDVSISDSTQITMGWSVKKSLIGKTLYNDEGQKVGKVEDLIISQDKSLSYVIVSAGGFLGIGQHDVAILITQIKDDAGKLVMMGATKETIKAMPAFNYATNTTQRNRFIAAAEKDIDNGKATIADLEKKASTTTADAKLHINEKITALQADVTVANAKLAEMKQATDTSWQEFKANVSIATARLRKSIETAAE